MIRNSMDEMVRFGWVASLCVILFWGTGGFTMQANAIDMNINADEKLFQVL